MLGRTSIAAAAPEPVALPKRLMTGAWRLPDGTYLLRGVRRHWPIGDIATMTLPDGSALDGWHDYWIHDRSGRRLRSFGEPRSYALDDYLYLHDLIEVCDGSLCRLMWEQKAGGSARVTVSAVELEGLEPCSLADVPFKVRPASI